jgi:hypothetical protein
MADRDFQSFTVALFQLLPDELHPSMSEIACYQQPSGSWKLVSDYFFAPFSSLSP